MNYAYNQKKNIVSTTLCPLYALFNDIERRKRIVLTDKEIEELSKIYADEEGYTDYLKIKKNLEPLAKYGITGLKQIYSIRKIKDRLLDMREFIEAILERKRGGFAFILRLSYSGKLETAGNGLYIKPERFHATKHHVVCFSSKDFGHGIILEDSYGSNRQFIRLRWKDIDAIESIWEILY